MHDTTALPLDEEIQRVAAEAMRIVLAHVEAGQLEQAATVCRAVLEMQPAHAQAHRQLGRLAWQANDLPLAAHHLSSALQADPHDTACWCDYVEVLLDGRETGAAREVLDLARGHGVTGAELERLAERAARLERGAPSGTEIDAIAGAFAQGRIDEVDAMARALARDCPHHGYGWKALGMVYHQRGQPGPALEAMALAAQCDPDDAETLSNLGLLLNIAGRLDEAERRLRRSLELDPANPHAHNNLGIVLIEARRLDEAEACVRAALARAPHAAGAWNTLGIALQRQNRLGEAVEAHRRALALEPGNDAMHSNMLFAMSQLEEMDAGALFCEHRRFGERLEAANGQTRAHGNGRDPQRPLRIGFLSADLRTHAVASFVGPVLERLAGRPGLSLYAYHNHHVHDEVSERLRGYTAQWRVVAGMDDDALDACIRADGIDILVDLSGHTAHNRLPVMARKPAPIQATWIGYPGSTGLRAVDYYLSDRFILPPGRFDHLFSEKLVQLPMAAPFMPHCDAPEPGPLPALANGHVTFGSFNRISKIGRSVVAAWGRLLRALPDSRLVMGGLPENGGADRLLGWLAEEGVDAARVRLHPHCDLRDYLALHRQIDVALDSFPYSGGTTTMYALWMGVPPLSVAGDSAAGRQTSCILEHLGLRQFIADDPADIERKGVAACGSPAALAALADVRAGLRRRLADPAAGHPALVADGIEDAFRLMWRRWCDGLPAATFEVPPRRG